MIVSRGELVEIGGAFRVPDVIQQGGAKLREVGTTNRTRARDYAEAVDEEDARRSCACIARTSRSSASPRRRRSRSWSRSRAPKKVPLLYDEGSGRVVDLAPYGFARGETIRELIAAGVDAVTCSTDKLIGATQGGLILGRAEIVARCRRHPLHARAARGQGDVRGRRRDAARLRHRQARAADPDLPDAGDAAGGAARPRRGADARHVRARRRQPLRPRRRHDAGGDDPVRRHRSPGERRASCSARFLRNDPPIVGRIVDDRFTIEVRTLLDDDLPRVTAALRGVAAARD